MLTESINGHKKQSCVRGVEVYFCIVLFLSLLFSSCENFLEGSDFKKQLEKDISYSKAEQFSITIGLLKTEHGQISPSGEGKYRVTDKINIEFYLSSDYKFDGFKVIDKDTREVDNDNAVTIGEITESIAGTYKLYKTVASVNYVKQNLMIVPLCTLINDKVAPSFYSTDEENNPAVKVSRNKTELENGIYITKQEIGNYDISWIFDEESCKKRLISSPYIKATVKEEDSTLKSLNVTENFFADAINSEGIVTFGDIEPTSKKVGIVDLSKLLSKNDGVYEIELPYEFITTSAFKRDTDGLYRIDIYVTDSNGNESDKVSFYIVKDTFLDISNITVVNYGPNLYNEDYKLDQYKTIFINKENDRDDTWAIYSTPQDKLIYTLKWGTDPYNLKSKTVTDTCKHPYSSEYKFGAVLDDVDESKFNILKLEVQDEAGNISVIEKLIPPKPELSFVKENEDSCELNFRSYSYEQKQLTNSISYNLNLFYSESGEYNYSPSSNSSKILIDKYFTCKMPYLSLKNGLCGPVNNDLVYDITQQVSDFTIPSFIVDVTSLGPESGLYQVRVLDSKDNISFLEKYSLNEEITYLFSVEKTDENTKSLFLEDSFVLPYSFDAYQLKVIAKKDNKIVESDSIDITETQIDNQSPSFDSSNIANYTFFLKKDEPKKVNIYSSIFDTSFEENVNCNVYYTDYNSTWAGALDIYSNEQIRVLPYVSTIVPVSHKCINNIPLSLKYLKQDGNYLISVEVYDNSYNSFIKQIGVAHVETVLPPIIDSFKDNTNSTKIVTCKLQNDASYERQDTYELITYYWDNNWIYAGNINTANKINSATSKTSQTLPAINMPAFVKTYLYAYSEDNGLYNNWNGEYYTSSLKCYEAFSPPVYKMFSITPITCYSKAIIETSTKTVILNDQPVFVHLVSACENYGTDIEKWERFGEFYDEKVIDPAVTAQTMNTYDIDFSNVPDGEWYVIIAWFADGTSDISSVRRK